MVLTMDVRYYFCGVYCSIVNLCNQKVDSVDLVMENIHQTWHGNCFVFLSKWDWNCMVKQFLYWNLICLMLFLDDISPIHFDLCFVLGWQKSNPVWFGIDIFIDWPYLALSISLCLFPNEIETVWTNSLNLNFGLVYLILFLDEHSLIHLQIIFHFVANFNSAF